MHRALLLVVVLVLAGCARPDPAEVDAAAAESATEAGALRARVASTGRAGGEPTIAVTEDGAILVTVFAFEAIAFASVPAPALVRSTDDGATWEEIGADATASPVSLDPWLALDEATGRLFETQLLQGCSWLRWSDDAGDTWTPAPLAGCGLPAHDHQKLAVGPPPAGTATLGYPSALYYAYNSLLPAPLCYQETCGPRFGTVVSASLDGGHTWPVSGIAHAMDPCYRGINGQPAVTADGTVLVPKPVCDGVALAASTDGGLTWTIEHTFAEETATTHFWVRSTDAAAGAEGGAVVAWRGTDAAIHFAERVDGAWSEAQRVSPPEVLATAFAAVATGGPGDAVVAYLGTDSDPATWASNDPSDAPSDAVWHLYVSVLDGEDFTTVRAAEDPVQVGCIWLRGGDSACRNLFDFLEVATRGPRAYVAFTDGCVECALGEQSSDGEVAVAIIER